jgi:transposase
MQKKVKTISFKGQSIFIGIDVHLKSWTITIVVGEVVYKAFSQDPCAEKLKNYLVRNFPDANYYSVYEAGFCGFSIHRQLESNGIKNIIVNPADIPTTDKERKQKEDRRDSSKLARGLKNGALESIYVMDDKAEELRSLVRYRKTTMKELCRHKNRVKSLLYSKGIKVPPELNTASKYWSKRFTNWLNSVELSTVNGKMVLDDTVDTAEFLRKKLLKINQQFRSLSKDSEYAKSIQLLRSIPGIGLIVAITFLSELGTITRFKNLDKLCSFVGLVPSTFSSGEKEIVGNITRRSNNQLRSSIVEASWVAIRHDPALTLKYNKLRSRMEPNEAIIRIAKKLLNRIRYVLQNEQEYICSVVS